MLHIATVVPHGDEVLEPTNESMKKLNVAMRKIGERAGDSEVFVLISPHNIRIATHIGIILTEYLEGSWEYENVKINLRLKGDRELAGRIYREAKDSSIPVVGINFGALEGPLSSMPLDWGSLIPLSFFPERKLVLLTPARGIKREELVNFGKILGDIIEKDPRKISLIISADHAHTHSKNGPYGYSELAGEYDEKIIESMRNGDLTPLLSMSDEFLEEVKPDSYWQLLILHGAIEKIKMKNEFVEYGIADYFGMAAALFSRT